MVEFGAPKPWPLVDIEMIRADNADAHQGQEIETVGFFQRMGHTDAPSDQAKFGDVWWVNLGVDKSSVEVAAICTVRGSKPVLPAKHRVRVRGTLRKRAINPCEVLGEVE
jgi:hypothetical protein